MCFLVTTLLRAHLPRPIDMREACHLQSSCGEERSPGPATAPVSLLVSAVLMVALCSIALPAIASPAERCAESLSVEELDQALKSTLQLQEHFRAAFASLEVSATPASYAAVRGALLGASMGSEANAALHGLRSLAQVRNDFYRSSSREAVNARLAEAMERESKRLHALAVAYERLATMQSVPVVRDLALRGAEFNQTTSDRLKCP